jgi:hypothetical protein
MLPRALPFTLLLAALPAQSQIIRLQSGESITIGSKTIQCNIESQVHERPLFCQDDYITNRFSGQRLDRLGSSCINKTTGWLYCADRVIKGPDGMAIGASTANERACLDAISGKFACNDRNLYNFDGKLLFEFVAFDDCKVAHSVSTYCRGDALKDWNGSHLEQYSSVADCLSHLY